MIRNYRQSPVIAMLAAVLFAACASVTPAQDKAEAKNAEQEEGPAANAPKLPFIDLNLKEGYADLEGGVCLREGPLELLVTVQSAKEHESVFYTKARPQHIHLTLLLLGAKPGSPGKWIYEPDRVIAVDPTGSPVAVSVIYELDGEMTEVPINRFARNLVTGELLDSNQFVFAGSRMIREADEEPVYTADQTGDVLTLVSFPDEMLSYPKAASSSNDKLNWTVNTDLTPELKTPVTIRLRPINEK